MLNVGLRCRHLGAGNVMRAARDVVQPDAVEELDAARVCGLPPVHPHRQGGVLDANHALRHADELADTL